MKWRINASSLALLPSTFAEEGACMEEF